MIDSLLENNDDVVLDDDMGSIKLNDVIHYALTQFRGGRIHGLSHWQNVENNGLRLAAMTKGVNIRVIRLFAYLHDHKRRNDGYDTNHGPAAADALYDIKETLLSDLSEEEFEMLYIACKRHTAATVSTGNPTIDVCIDSDRLDLPRVGITPDPERMLSAAGRILAEEEW